MRLTDKGKRWASNLFGGLVFFAFCAMFGFVIAAGFGGAAW